MKSQNSHMLFGHDMILAVDNLRPWRKYMNEDHHHFIEQQHKIFFQAQ